MIVGEYISNEIKNGIRKIKLYCFGKDDVREAAQYTPSGIDSSPIKGMKAIYAQTSRSTEPVIIGYINESTVEEGEIQIFSLNSDGEQQSYVKCVKDGNVELNGNEDFAIAYNDMKDAFDELKEDLNTFIDDYNLHTHVAPSGTTGTPSITGTPSSADMNAAKVDTIKLP